MTSFEKIYKPFLASVQDVGLGYLTKEEFYEALEEYLIKAVVLDFKECNNSLEFVPNSEYYQSFRGNGLTEEFFIEHDIKNTIYSTFLIHNEEVVDECYYNIDSKNLILTLQYRIGVEDKIELTLKEIGYFVEDLTQEEISILAEIMVLHWIRKQINREENLQASISTSDFKKTSNANLLDKLMLLAEKQEQIVENYKVKYTMEGFDGFY